MSRSTGEWIGKTDDAKIPPRVDRKQRGGEWDIHYFMTRSKIDRTSGCWEWQRALRWNGYGAVRHNGRTVGAHRLSYEIANRVIVSRKLDVCHRCDNRRCVNPDHLFVGTRKENMRDCANKKRIIVPSSKGESCPAAKLSEDDVLTIRSSNLSQRELGRRYNVDKGTISHILQRKTWRHI